MAGCRRLTDREVILILNSCYDLFSLSVAERLVAQFTVMLNTGIRINECCHLQVGDVSEGGRVAPVLTVKRCYAKGKKRGRSVPLNDFARRELARWLNYSNLVLAGSNDWLFPPGKGSCSNQPLYWFDRPVTHKAVRKCLARITAARKIGGPVSCHSFRKTFGWQVYRASGNDILVAMHALGHASPQHTLAYLEIAGEDVTAAIGKIYIGAV
jgi:integrase/recombinase XerC